MGEGFVSATAEDRCRSLGMSERVSGDMGDVDAAENELSEYREWAWTEEVHIVIRPPSTQLRGGRTQDLQATLESDMGREVDITRRAGAGPRTELGRACGVLFCWLSAGVNTRVASDGHLDVLLTLTPSTPSPIPTLLPKLLIYAESGHYNDILTLRYELTTLDAIVPQSQAQDLVCCAARLRREGIRTRSGAVLAHSQVVDKAHQYRTHPCSSRRAHPGYGRVH
ncbi:hypothetical protein MKEN_01334100 [Mycena kentingensis (nom. inval.)]|nr:hypothetical protein MKEN_01334100 [Mycena kentingensis (nom. inval.)]